MDQARAEIERLRGALQESLPLFKRTDLSFRNLVWERIDRQIRNRLFDFDWLGEYPRRGDRADDARALEVIDRVLAALESPGALSEALEDDGEGVFVRAVGRAIRAMNVEDAWDRVEARIRLWLGSTD